MSERSPNRFSWLECLVVLGIVLVLGSMLIPVVRSVQGDAAGRRAPIEIGINTREEILGAAQGRINELLAPFFGPCTFGDSPSFVGQVTDVQLRLRGVHSRSSVTRGIEAQSLARISILDEDRREFSAYIFRGDGYNLEQFTKGDSVRVTTRIPASGDLRALVKIANCRPDENPFCTEHVWEFVLVPTPDTPEPSTR